MKRFFAILGRCCRGLACGLTLVLTNAAPALALQAHAYKGLYVHQGAHVFFLLAMVCFALRIQRTWLTANRSWRLIVWGAWLLALWNLWAFTGHFLELFIPESSVFLPPGHRVPVLVLSSWKEVVYFLLKMDHLLTVPAIFCFYFGLRGILAGFTPPRKAADEARS